MARIVRAPVSWFVNPGLRQPTRLTVTEEGCVFGHAACWNTPHLLSGYLPPKSLDFSHFRRDTVTCRNGSTVRVGPVTLGVPHASLALSSSAAVAHYRAGVTIADVTVGPDQWGIWVAGAVRFGQHGIELLRGLHLSGDWRPVDGRPRLLALLAVTNPAFPIPVPVKEAVR